MREIKFRAWVRRLDKMCNVTGIDFERNEINILRPGWHMSEWLRRDQVEIMQYTGLKDMNGVEIYECDVVRFDTNVQILESEVTYYHGMFTIKKYGEKILLFTALKVIGNKFENPELLGVEE
ncbi:hypothetical protein FGL79_00040 [Latilactobacillus curvatus]|uniref:YopX family protein n=1 Tax=Latilactobacillus curvatus TaxID=28038 RepID=UPI0011BAEA25|nr:YopX family protein [Latilactobacillus curvatus]QEA48370.1 hypothetical protein FGL79_00040 [Latilactobacillus curvatus]